MIDRSGRHGVRGAIRRRRVCGGFGLFLRMHAHHRTHGAQSGASDGLYRAGLLQAMLRQLLLQRGDDLLAVARGARRAGAHMHMVLKARLTLLGVRGMLKFFTIHGYASLDRHAFELEQTAHARARLVWRHFASDHAVIHHDGRGGA